MHPGGKSRGADPEDEERRSGDEEEHDQPVIEPGVEVADDFKPLVEADVCREGESADDRHADRDEDRQIHVDAIARLEAGDRERDGHREPRREPDRQREHREGVDDRRCRGRRDLVAEERLQRRGDREAVPLMVVDVGDEQSAQRVDRVRHEGPVIVGARHREDSGVCRSGSDAQFVEFSPDVAKINYRFVDAPGDDAGGDAARERHREPCSE